MVTESEIPQDTQLPPEQEIGPRLVRARQEQELSLEKAAASLRVDVGVLQSLENENFAALGAQVFVRGHLRKYARLLQLPEQEMLDAYQSRVGASEAHLMHSVLRETVPISRRRRRVNLSLVFLTILVVSLLAAAAWWWFQMRAMDTALEAGQRSTSNGKSLALPMDGREATALDVPVTVEDKDVAQALETVPGSPASQVNGEPESDGQEVPAVEPQVQPEKSVLEPVVQEISPVPGPQMHVVMEFVEDSWAEVHDGNQKRVLYGLFRAGTSRELDIPGPASVYLGRVQGVVISVDGTSFDVPQNRRAGNTARFTIEPPR
jgi:cytoskeleton protein RodZ